MKKLEQSSSGNYLSVISKKDNSNSGKDCVRLTKILELNSYENHSVIIQKEDKYENTKK